MAESISSVAAVLRPPRMQYLFLSMRYSSFGCFLHESLPTLFLAAASLYLVNGNFYALWAFPVVLLASTVDLSVPRSPWAFYVLYPAHLAVLAVVALGRSPTALL